VVRPTRNRWSSGESGPANSPPPLPTTLCVSFSWRATLTPPGEDVNGKGCCRIDNRGWRIRPDACCRDVCASSTSERRIHVKERHVCATRVPTFPLFPARVGQTLPLRAGGEKRPTNEPGMLMKTKASSLQKITNCKTAGMAGRSPRAPSKQKFGHKALSQGRGWPAAALSSATAGRVRGWFRST